MFSAAQAASQSEKFPIGSTYKSNSAINKLESLIKNYAKIGERSTASTLMGLSSIELSYVQDRLRSSGYEVRYDGQNIRISW